MVAFTSKKYNTARIHEHGLYTYSNHYSTYEAYIQRRPYSQVNLDRMALQLALTKARPRRLYIPKMLLRIIILCAIIIIMKYMLQEYTHKHSLLYIW